MRIWVAEHDARINQYWKTQWRRNDSFHREIHRVRERVGRVEGKVIWASGAAAAFGAMIGTLPLLLKLLGG